MSQRDTTKDQAQTDKVAATLRAFAKSFRTNSPARNSSESFISSIAAESMESMALMFEKAGRLDIKPSDTVDQGERN